MTLSEQQKELTAITLAVTAELGAPWNIVPPRESYDATNEIANNDGAKLYLRIQYNHTDRVNISGSMHFEVNGRLQYVSVYENGQKLDIPSVSVAIKRGPAAIAKEIKRRLLPSYLHAVELAKADSKRMSDNTARRQANIRELVALSEGARLPDFQMYPDADRFYLGKRSGTVVAHCDGRVNFERLDVTMEEAEFILRYLKGKEQHA